jgi:clan AA aspartic protease (TIGR02281 family)
MNLRIIISVIAIILLLSSAIAANETIYRWKDKNGVLHMTNVPPAQPQDDMEVLEIKPPQVVGEPEIQYAKPEAESAEKLETPVSIVGDHVIVPVSLTYKTRTVKANLLLDTGASKITLHRDIAERLSVENPQKGSIRVAGGELIEAEAITLDSVTVGPNTKRSLTAGIIDHNGPAVAFEGLLGMNFLRNLHYTVDFENRVIRWHR